MSTDTDTIIPMVADVVSAYIANNQILASDLPALIRNVHGALAGLGGPAATPEAEAQQPAVSVRASVKPEYLICLEDGKKLTMLKRYLRTNYQMTPADYRAKWNLPADYPMVAPNYSARRSHLAMSLGLGRKKSETLIVEGVLESPADAGEIVSDIEPIVDAPAEAKPKRKVGRPANAPAAVVEAPDADIPVDAPSAVPIEGAKAKRRAKPKVAPEGDAKGSGQAVED